MNNTVIALQAKKVNFLPLLKPSSIASETSIKNEVNFVTLAEGQAPKIVHP